MQSEYIKTVKFGGSSLADAEHFVKVANIIKSDPTRRYVVPSAPGKRFGGDFKVTDKLYELHMKFTQNADWEDINKTNAYRNVATRRLTRTEHGATDDEAMRRVEFIHKRIEDIKLQLLEEFKPCFMEIY